MQVIMRMRIPRLPRTLARSRERGGGGLAVALAAVGVGGD
jgi:hypothetical protein